MRSPRTLQAVSQAIVHCTRCPRLRDHCLGVARIRKAAHRDETYWGLPVPGFGDPQARVLILGLAPAAHGANRTGRLFTGDSSGHFLMAALHRAGLANLPTSTYAGDGLMLRDVYISAAVRCAPPGNRPSRDELAACRPHLEAEVRLLRRLEIVVVLGRIAFEAWLGLLRSRGQIVARKPPFVHGAVYHPAARSPLVVCSYHPSRQNTNTRRLTARMFDRVFQTVLASTRSAGRP